MPGAKPLIILMCAALTGSVSVQAQIYRTTDEQGNVVFTDQPPAGDKPAEEVELKRLNTAPAPTPLPRAPAKPEPAPGPEYSLSIQFPADETTIPMGPGNFSVVASTAPPLAGGETLQLQIDGTPQGEPQSNGSWELTNVFRGARQLTVQRLSADGKVLATSAPVTVYVHRPSIKFNAN